MSAGIQPDQGTDDPQGSVAASAPPRDSEFNAISTLVETNFDSEINNPGTAAEGGERQRVTAEVRRQQLDSVIPAQFGGAGKNAGTAASGDALTPSAHDRQGRWQGGPGGRGRSHVVVVLEAREMRQPLMTGGYTIMAGQPSTVGVTATSSAVIRKGKDAP